MTLAVALDTLLRLFAPFLPFVSEEVWSWWREGSLHRAAWPDADALRSQADGADPGVYERALTVLGEVRKAKTSAKRSLRTGVVRAVVTAPAEQLDQLEAARGDLCDSGVIANLELRVGDTLTVEALLAAPEPG